MNNRTKIILTAIGLGAVLIPVVLLFFLTGKMSNKQTVDNSPRKIDTNAIQGIVQQNQKVLPYPSPSPATASAKPAEGSQSAQ